MLRYVTLDKESKGSIIFDAGATMVLLFWYCDKLTVLGIWLKMILRKKLTRTTESQCTKANLFNHIFPYMLLASILMLMYCHAVLWRQTYMVHSEWPWLQVPWDGCQRSLFFFFGYKNKLNNLWPSVDGDQSPSIHKHNITQRWYYLHTLTHM